MRIFKRVSVLLLVAAIGIGIFLKFTGTVILSNGQVSSSVEAVLAALDEHYVYPDIASEMRASVESRMSEGAYGNLYTNWMLIDQLHSDLRETSNDLHISLRPYNAGQKQAPGNARDSGQGNGLGVERQYSGDVAYIEVKAFPFSVAAKAAVEKAVMGHAGAKAFIVDLRRNGGGSLLASADLAALFLPPGTPLYTLVDRNGRIIGAHVTPTSPDVEPLVDVPLYVLTSNKTFSAAEYFVWSMKRHGRAQIVGETTGGGAHPIEDVQIDQYFTLRIPIGRPVLSGSVDDWQGVGHAPDIAVPANAALEKALAVIKAQEPTGPFE